MRGKKYKNEYVKARESLPGLTHESDNFFAYDCKSHFDPNFAGDLIVGRTDQATKNSLVFPMNRARELSDRLSLVADKLDA